MMTAASLPPIRFARAVFTGAGIWGIAVLTPFYFLFDLMGRIYPPPITHPDLYFGFVGVALAWQIAFLTIGRDPVRYHPLMIAAIVEKLVYVGTLAVLYVQERLPLAQFSVAVPDFVLAILFCLSYVRVARLEYPASRRG